MRKSKPFLQRLAPRESISKIKAEGFVSQFSLPISVQSCGSTKEEEKMTGSPEKTFDLLGQLITQPWRNKNIIPVTKRQPPKFPSLPVESPYVSQPRSRQASSSIRYRKVDLKGESARSNFIVQPTQLK